MYVSGSGNARPGPVGHPPARAPAIRAFALAGRALRGRPWPPPGRGRGDLGSQIPILNRYRYRYRLPLPPPAPTVPALSGYIPVNNNIYNMFREFALSLDPRAGSGRFSPGRAGIAGRGSRGGKSLETFGNYGIILDRLEDGVLDSLPLVWYHPVVTFERKEVMRENSDSY